MKKSLLKFSVVLGFGFVMISAAGLGQNADADQRRSRFVTYYGNDVRMVINGVSRPVNTRSAFALCREHHPRAIDGVATDYHLERGTIYAYFKNGRWRLSDGANLIDELECEIPRRRPDDRRWRFTKRVRGRVLPVRANQQSADAYCARKFPNRPYGRILDKRLHRGSVANFNPRRGKWNILDGANAIVDLKCRRR